MYLRDIQGFPDGSVVKNLPADAGDTGSNPNPGRSIPHASEQPLCRNYWASAFEAMLCKKKNHHNEKPVHN